MSLLQPAPASYLAIKHISHNYGPKIALDDVSLDAQKGQILALLGPSGSGKSTLLAVIAGILKPNAGQIFVDGCNLLDLAPEARGLGMVFQDYALWPHMSVAENVSFPLRSRRCPAQEVRARVDNALKRVALSGYEKRRPHELSGGQQQRVALARAVVAETRLLLLDEPLSALDPATRSSVRSELAEILRTLGLTTIIVTHDREEAFELADRIAVLIDGRIQQFAKPEEVYERPANLTVARFMGVNLLPIHVVRNGEAESRSGERRIRFGCESRPGPAHIAVVPERTWIAANHAASENTIPGRLVRAQYRGGEYRLQVAIGSGEARSIVEVRSKDVPPRESVLVHLPVEAIHVIQPALSEAQTVSLSEQRAPQEISLFNEETA